MARFVVARYAAARPLRLPRPPEPVNDFETPTVSIY